MNRFIKFFLLCFGIDPEPYHFSKYQPEGNRFIYNDNL
jgi:hypothetical protein